QNMDTGIRYAFAVPTIPTNLGDDVTNLDQRSVVIRVEQDITRWLLAGYRYDFYTPNTSIKDNGKDTHGFVLVARFSPNLRLMNEIDYGIDNIHAAGTEPPHKHALAYSSVLQASF